MMQSAIGLPIFIFCLTVASLRFCKLKKASFGKSQGLIRLLQSHPGMKHFFCCAHPISPKEYYQQYVCVQWNSKEGKEGTQTYITDNTPLAKLGEHNGRNLFHS